MLRCCRTCCAVYRSGFERCPTDGTALSSFESDPIVGAVINDLYEVEECVGEGAMGRVYRAHHLRLTQRQVALKILLGDLAASVAMRLRFTQEAQAASVLSHPNVVPVLDFGKTPQGLLFLAMEYVEGSSLARIIAEEGPLDPARVVRLIRQLCLGLGHAHGHGLVHRDFKPDNVLVVDDPDGEIPRIADFGLAIFADTASESARLTSAGTVVGTPLYTAPEQALDRGVDHRADLFALGVTMYEMLAGCPPFEDSSPVEVLHNNLAAPRPRIAQRAPRVIVPPQLEQIALRLMSSDRDQRFASAHAVIEALDRFERERRDEMTAQDNEETLPGIPRPRSGRRVALAVLAAGVVMAGLAGLWPASSRRPVDGAEGALAIAPAAATTAATPTTPADPGRAGPDPATGPAEPAVIPEPHVVQLPAPTAPTASSPPRRTAIANNATRPPRGRGKIFAAAPIAGEGSDEADAAGRAAGLSAAVAARPASLPAREGAAAADRSDADQVGERAAGSPNGAGGVGDDRRSIVEPALPTRPDPAPRARVSPDLRALRAVIEGMTVDGSLSDAEVRRGIQRITPRLAGCGRRAGARGSPGAVRVSFTVDENGRARDVRSGGDSPAVAACVADAFAGVRTRVAPDVGEVRVSLRVDFSPSGPP